MMVGFRDPARKDSTHLAFVRLQPCCCGCGRQPPSEAAHIRYRDDGMDKRPTGMQEKSHDRYTVPLNEWCHRSGPGSQHSGGERAYWERIGKDPFAIAARLWTESGGEDRAAQERPVKPLRPVKRRKPPEKRKKIATGRPLQSRSSFPSRKFLDQRTAQ